MQVPWTKLGKEPVIVEFDRVYVLAGPYSGEGKADAQVSVLLGKLHCVRSDEIVTALRKQAAASGPFMFPV